MYRHNCDVNADGFFNTAMKPVVFKNNANVSFDFNSTNIEGGFSDGYYDESNSTMFNILEVFDSKLSISNNQYNGYAYANARC